MAYWLMTSMCIEADREILLVIDTKLTKWNDEEEVIQWYQYLWLLSILMTSTMTDD